MASPEMVVYMRAEAEKKLAREMERFCRITGTQMAPAKPYVRDPQITAINRLEELGETLQRFNDGKEQPESEVA